MGWRCGPEAREAASDAAFSGLTVTKATQADTMHARALGETGPGRCNVDGGAERSDPARHHEDERRVGVGDLVQDGLEVGADIKV